MMRSQDSSDDKNNIALFVQEEHKMSTSNFESKDYLKAVTYLKKSRIESRIVFSLSEWKSQ